MHTLVRWLQNVAVHSCRPFVGSGMGERGRERRGERGKEEEERKGGREEREREVKGGREKGREGERKGGRERGREEGGREGEREERDGGQRWWTEMVDMGVPSLLPPPGHDGPIRAVQECSAHTLFLGTQLN